MCDLESCAAGLSPPGGTTPTAVTTEREPPRHSVRVLRGTTDSRDTRTSFESTNDSSGRKRSTNEGPIPDLPLDVRVDLWDSPCVSEGGDGLFPVYVHWYTVDRFDTWVT